MFVCVLRLSSSFIWKYAINTFYKKWAYLQIHVQKTKNILILKILLLCERVCEQVVKSVFLCSVCYLCEIQQKSSTTTQEPTLFLAQRELLLLLS